VTTEETHPEPEQIRRFLLGEGDSATNQHVARHLLRGCPECQKLARAAWYRTADFPWARLVLAPRG
jgi:hypothetical protein